MSSEEKLFVVIMNSMTDYNVSDCFEIFKDLELAKQMLKNICNTTVDPKYDNYEIKVYKFNKNKYELTNEYYTYNLKKIIAHS